MGSEMAAEGLRAKFAHQEAFVNYMKELAAGVCSGRWRVLLDGVGTALASYAAGKLWCLLCLALRPARPGKPSKGRSSVCCSSCRTMFTVNDGFVIRKKGGQCMGKLTELAVVARKVIEKAAAKEKAKQQVAEEEKAKQAKEVLIISDSD